MTDVAYFCCTELSMLRGDSVIQYGIAGTGIGIIALKVAEIATAVTVKYELPSVLIRRRVQQ